MDESKETETFEALPLRSAYEFLAGKGLSDEATQIRTSKDKYKSYDTTLKRGKIAALLEKNNLLSEFMATQWPFGKTEKGNTRLARYKRIYDSFMGSQGSVDEEEEEESPEETAFAYEDNLRDYLARNLHKIEKGMSLYIDSEGRKGVEYPIDAEGRRIDILAIDSLNIPTIIELKVSRGHEKVIGQALYYKNRVKEIFKSENAKIVIVAKEISSELKTAVVNLPDCALFEYELAVNLKRV